MSDLFVKLNRRSEGRASDRDAVAQMIRGLNIMRSVGFHDSNVLRRTIEEAVDRLRRQDFAEAELQRLRNYARTLR
jgi:hypothetical protein